MLFVHENILFILRCQFSQVAVSEAKVEGAGAGRLVFFPQSSTASLMNLSPREGNRRCEQKQMLLWE